ncbi:alpha/beta fold hydrolase [Polaribacter sp. R77954]|uniref:alpha/beta fold hydrolase n=1 Tax=Polaribacter sp. R77954 TaxID=3093870 RepID=UPI0037CB78D4
MELKEWAEKGQMVSVLGRDVFVIDIGKSDETLVILHGYGTSSIDYYKVLPQLTQNYRVIIQDFIGFGFSDKPVAYYFNILEQADVTLELWRILGLKNIILLSHNYGNLVSLEILKRVKTEFANIQIQKLLFLNSTISFNYKNNSNDNVQPLEEFAKITRLMSCTFSFYKKKMKEFFFDGNKISDEDIKAKWDLLQHNNGDKTINFLYDYNTESKLLWSRWFSYLKHNKIPTKIISGKNDAIFIEEEALLLAEEFNNSTLNLIENCGHYPMLEQPEEFLQLVFAS